MPVDDLIEPYTTYLREESHSPRTIRDYRRTLLALDRDLPHGVDIAIEEELKAWLWRDGLAPASRATYYAAMKAFYRWAVKKAGVITYDPSADITRPRVPEGLPRAAGDDDVIRVLTEARQPYRLWAQLAAFAGLRCIEVWRLHREHITERSIRVHRGKGEKAREIPTHPIIWQAVSPLPAGPLVTVSTERYVSQYFHAYCQEQLGMSEMSMHRIRGWFATTGYRHTKDIQGLKRLLGHANLNTTARYIAVADDQLTAIVAAIPSCAAGAGGAPATRPVR